MFSAYWFNSNDTGEPMPEPQVVRYIVGAF